MAENASTDGGMSGSQGDSAAGGDSDSRADARSGSTADTRAGAEAQAHESGSGWGGFNAAKDSQAANEALGLGPNSDTNVTDIGYLEGFNKNNPTQTLDQLDASKRASGWGYAVRDMLGYATMGPAYGLAKAGAGVVADVSGGKSLGDALASAGKGLIGDKVAGAINGSINAATGGAYGQLGLIGSVSKTLGGPGMPNVGGMVAGGAGLGKGPSSPGLSIGRAENGFSYDGGADRPDGSNVPNEPTSKPPSNDVKEIANQPSVDYTMFGHVDQSGWGRAINDYVSKKQGVAS